MTNQRTEDLNDTGNQLNLVDVSTTPCTIAEHRVFSRAQGTFAKLDSVFMIAFI